VTEYFLKEKSGTGGATLGDLLKERAKSRTESPRPIMLYLSIWQSDLKAHLDITADLHSITIATHVEGAVANVRILLVDCIASAIWIDSASCSSLHYIALQFAVLCYNTPPTQCGKNASLP
jgi:hypothetical protein